MTLKEALESAKPFRRKADRNGWCMPGGNTSFSVEDILADDWQVKVVPRDFIIYNLDGKWFVATNPELIEYKMGQKILEMIQVREVLSGSGGKGSMGQPHRLTEVYT